MRNCSVARSLWYFEGVMIPGFSTSGRTDSALSVLERSSEGAVFPIPFCFLLVDLGESSIGRDLDGLGTNEPVATANERDRWGDR